MARERMEKVELLHLFFPTSHHLDIPDPEGNSPFCAWQQVHPGASSSRGSHTFTIISSSGSHCWTGHWKQWRRQLGANPLGNRKMLLILHPHCTAQRQDVNSGMWHNLGLCPAHLWSLHISDSAEGTSQHLAPGPALRGSRR